MDYFIKTEDNTSGILTSALDSAETSTAHVSPVPEQAPGLIRFNPGNSKEEEVYYTTRDAGAGTIGGLTRDVSNLNGGVGQDHSNNDSYEIMQSSSYVNRIVDGIKKALSQTGRILTEKLFAADAGSNDTYAVTLDPAPTAYTNGLMVTFKANTANTGAATLNVNGLGAKTIKRDYNVDLNDGDIKAGQIVEVIYDGTNFQLLSPAVKTLITSFLAASEAQGDILYRGASTWERLAASTAGLFLKTQGAGANPVWAAPGGVTVEIGTFTITNAGGTGNKTITLSNASLTPKLVLILGRYTTGTGFTMLSIGGFVPSGNQFAICIADAVSANSLKTSTSACLLATTSAGADRRVASGVSAAAGQFVLNATDVGGGSDYDNYSYIVLG